MDPREFRASRRAFFKTLTFGVGAFLALPLLRFRQGLAWAAGKVVDKTHALYVPMAYVEDAKEAEKRKKAGEQQFQKYAKGQDCKACIFYKGDAKQGPCTIFQDDIVKAKAWCMSFAPKPKA